jgi:hypothetical protein
MIYTNYMLLACGALGILAHCLVEVMKLKRIGKFYSYGQYLKEEVESILLSAVVVTLSIICKHEIKILEAAGMGLGIGFAAIGYAGQSVFVAWMGKIQKKLKDDNDTDNSSGVKSVILLIGMSAALASCSSERSFVRFHGKNDSKAAKYCGVWYPVKDSIHERITYKPGETIYIPGETMYANCDSAYIAALDEAVRTGTRVVVQKVAVPCPPSTVKYDTIERTKIVYSENTATITWQAAEITTQTKIAEQYKTGLQKWRSRAIWAGVILSLEVIALILWLIFKAKGSVI